MAQPGYQLPHGNPNPSSATPPTAGAGAASRDLASLPSYLRRHVQLGFDSDDIAALLSSIDSSQAPLSGSSSCTTSLAHLPAELLLQIVEYVPVDYVLDWRLVCRGFRDAIDGQVLYHHLRRTRLLGYMGGRESRAMEHLSDDEYEAIHLLEARFSTLETSPEGDEGEGRDGKRRPIWRNSHAVFRIDDEWYRAFRRIGGAEERYGDTIDDADPRWIKTLDRLELRRPEEGFGTLRWCIQLDHAVMDLDFPVEMDRMHFDIDIDLSVGRIRVAWRDMLVRFLKTERALRLLLDEKRAHPTFTFSHTEDCLRSIRRSRLASSLSPTSKLDRHIRWSLRLLHPLYGLPGAEHTMTLSTVENDAIHLLLLLRRTFSLSPPHLNYLHTLARDYHLMESQLRSLDTAYAEFKSYLSLPGFQMNILIPAMIANARCVPRNPVAWTDELTAKIEAQVARWRQQRSTLERVLMLLAAGNEAMGVPEDGWDDEEEEEEEGMGIGE